MSARLFFGVMAGTKKFSELVPGNVGIASRTGLTAEQTIELCFGRLSLFPSGWAVCVWPGFKPITEIRVFLVAYLFRPLLAALAGDTRIVEFAQAAGMEISPAFRTLCQAA